MTGKNCEEAIYVLEDTMRALKGLFNNAKDLQGVIAKYMEEHESMKKEIEQFQAQAIERTKNMLVERAELRNGIKVVKAVLPLEPGAAKDLVFKIRQAVPENLNAGQMVREAAKLMQGGGGGQPHYATAGGKNKDGLTAAVEKVIQLAEL